MRDPEGLYADLYEEFQEGEHLLGETWINLGEDEVTDITTDGNMENTFAAIRKCSKKFKKEIFESTGLRNIAETECKITERELYRALKHTLKGFLSTSKTANQTP